MPDDAPGGPAPLITDFTGLETAGALGFGLLGLLVGGLFPLLLGALAGAGRLTEAELGIAATVETLVLGLTTAACAARLPPRRLRAIGAVASLALALANAASAGRSHWALLAIRALAGVPEGVLLWLAIGLIARTRLPERWTAVFTLGQPATQAAAAGALAALVLPHWGPDGAFLALAALGLAVIPCVAALPRAYVPIADDGGGGPLPALGRLALVGMAAYLGAVTLVAVFLGPLAADRQLSPAVLSATVTGQLIAETLGGVLAVAAAGRMRPLTSLLIATPVVLGAVAALWLARTGPLFSAADAAFGLGAFFGMPSLVALAIEADPTRRSAMQSGAAQLLGSAAAPLAGAAVAAAGLGVVMSLAAALVAGSVGAFLVVDRADRGRGPRADRAR